MAESSNDDVIDPNYATETAWLVKVPGELAAMIDTAENDMKIGVFLEEKLEEGAQRRFKKRRCVLCVLCVPCVLALFS